jgi:hypothetical protein
LSAAAARLIYQSLKLSVKLARKDNFRTKKKEADEKSDFFLDHFLRFFPKAATSIKVACLIGIW